MQAYQVFGLTVRSALPLPELFPASADEHADVTIRVGTIDDPTDEPGLHIVDGSLLFVARAAGRYLISDGRDILVEPNCGAPPQNVRIFLLGSAFGALLHQRGLLPLHANAIEIGGRAVAFLGESGAGKSTLAAWFHDRGYPVIADDVCVVGFDEATGPYATPGLPRLRLWAEALELSGREMAGYERSYVGPARDYDKFDVPIKSGRAARANVPLAALYLLGRGEEFAITRLEGVEAAEAVFANTYRGTYLSAAGGHERHWRSAVRLVQALPVFRASRKWALAELDAQSGRLLEHAVSVAAPRST